MIYRVIATAFLMGLAAVSVAAFAVLAAWLRVVPPIAGFAVFGLALLGGGVTSLFLGLASIFVPGAAEHVSRRAGMLAVVIGLGSLLLLGTLVRRASGVPAIHDITTETTDPPLFSAAAMNSANRGRDLSYPHGPAETPRLQEEAYADLQPIELRAGPDDAYQEALNTASDLGWVVVESNSTTRTFEAEDETSVFRFVDDIVVRVRPGSVGSVIDVRSTSRTGVGDMGVNADRIRRFRSALSSR